MAAPTVDPAVQIENMFTFMYRVNCLYEGRRILWKFSSLRRSSNLYLSSISPPRYKQNKRRKKVHGLHRPQGTPYIFNKMSLLKNYVTPVSKSEKAVINNIIG